jgi:hypothetical protein
MLNSIKTFIILLALSLFDLSTYFIQGSIHMNKISIFKGIPIIAILYVFQSLTILKALNIGNSITILNLAWNCISSIVVTLLGVFYFKDDISGLKIYGVLFALISIFLFGLDDYKS